MSAYKINRKIIAAGNWKMNMLPSQAGEFVKKLGELVDGVDVDVVICPPFVCLPAVIEAIALTPHAPSPEASGQGEKKSSLGRIKVGAQNMHWEEKGAFTGEVSPAMLVDMGVEYVIIGHSERRQYFAETNETVNKKVHSAFKYGLKPIVCVGETLEQREQGITYDLLRLQARIALLGLSEEQVKNTIIAYEPIWAIGTGKTASPQDANNAVSAIRQLVGEIYGEETAQTIRIQYGGSVNASNAKELFDMPDIDGGLVGGASLKVEDFEKIVKR